MEIIWSTRAFLTLADIYRFGRLNWSDDTAEKYQQRIRAVVQVISENPDIGFRRDSIVYGMRSFPVEAHTIYYRVDQAAVVIMAVLHSGADAHRTFEQSDEEF